MPINQENRLLAITTPLGPNVLAVRSISVQEQLSRLLQIEAELSSEDGEIEFDQIVGHNVTIRLKIGASGKRESEEEKNDTTTHPSKTRRPSCNHVAKM